MLSYGPDLNLSAADMPVDQVIDLGRKLTFYSPYMVPWSFSSPFYAGGLWGGPSVRTFLRSGQRPAVRVFVAREEQLAATTPVLTRLARTPEEVGRVEFKAFDSCADFSRYASLFALLKGLALDLSLPGRASEPDVALHQLAAREGFGSEGVRNGASRVLAAARAALGYDPDATLLDALDQSIEQRVTPADAMLDAYQRSGSILDVLSENRD
jgi:gamma-glutamyl:cysteine ligase YbdK (ATP-grasp superfamily)